MAAFFSYSHADSDFALRLTRDLKAAGIEVWLDQDISPGDRWDKTVQDALTKCEHLLVILSPDSVNSANVLDEVAFGLDTKKTVVPVLYRECEIPFRLRRVQWIDFRSDYAHGLEKMLTRLGEGPSVRQGVRAEAERVWPVQKRGRRSKGVPVALTLCGVLIVASLLYWMGAGSHRDLQEQAAGSQTAASAAQPAAPARVLPHLVYGAWTLHNAMDDDGKDFSNSVLQFTSQKETPDGLLLHGTFTWRENGILRGTEEFTGHYVDATREVILEGTAVKEVPHPAGRQLLVMGSYSARVSPDETSLVDGRWGSTSSERGWGVPGRWEATR